MEIFVINFSNRLNNKSVYIWIFRSYVFLNVLPFNYLIPTLNAKDFKLWFTIFLWVWYGSCIWNSVNTFPKYFSARLNEYLIKSNCFSLSYTYFIIKFIIKILVNVLAIIPCQGKLQNLKKPIPIPLVNI